MDENEKLVCKKCGSANVHKRVWMYANSKEHAYDCSDGEDEDTWCEKCTAHNGIISEFEYNLKN